MDSQVGIHVGNLAPPLTLHGSEGDKLSLATLRGRPVVVAFIDGWMAQVRETLAGIRAWLRSADATAILISDEHAWCVRPEAASVRAYSRPGEIAARNYGCELSRGRGFSVTIVDTEGLTRFAHVGRRTHVELTDALAEALEAATRRLCTARGRPVITTEEWSTLNLVAGFAHAFLDTRSRSKAGATASAAE